jgi:hypothetical protein
VLPLVTVIVLPLFFTLILPLGVTMFVPSFGGVVPPAQPATTARSPTSKVIIAIVPTSRLITPTSLQEHGRLSKQTESISSYKPIIGSSAEAFQLASNKITIYLSIFNRVRAQKPPLR